MTINLKQTRIGEVMSFQRGYDLTHNQMLGGNVPVVGSSDIIGYHNKVKKTAPVLLIGRSGTVGRPQYYNQNIWPHNTTLFVTDFHGNVPKYCYYLLKVLNLEDYANSTGVPTLNRNFIHPLKVNIHEVPQQVAIANILSSLDHKIDTNNKISNELEKMAKTIYDYWFVQFDFPCENGKPYKSSGGKMIWNEVLKRNIPEGWESDKLKGLINFDRGISYTSKDIESQSGIPMINLASIDICRNYRPNELKFFSGKYNPTSLIKHGDMLIACTDLTRNADIIGSPIIVPMEYKEYLFSMDLAKLNIITNRLLENYLYMTLRTSFYHNYIKYFASGTNVLHLNLDGILWYPIVVPPIPIQQKFSLIFKELIDKQALILNETETLSSLRDWLLPMLMNGQVTVREVGGEIESRFQ
ncbi:restriction endonuclease subunit S [Patescibacteria group bacterium]|nr:restriction endonuclease subunit S [Patescibacteria group bacterium]